MGRAERRLAKKIAEAGQLADGEEVIAALQTLKPSKESRGSPLAPLKRVVERKLNEGAYEAPADLDPSHEIELDRFGVVLVISDRRFLAFTEKGLSGGMADLVAEAPIDEVILRIHEGGRGPGKHRAYHLTLPDGRFLIRQSMGLVGPMKKMANAFDEAYVASGGDPS